MSDPIFGPSTLAKAVHDTLDAATAAIPEGRSHALIFDGTYSQDTGPAVRALYVQRTETGWKIKLEGGYDGPGGVYGKVATAKSW